LQVQKAEVRRRIVAAATEEFYLHGYQKASMRQIATSAHLATGNIYSYFKSKLELFNSLIEETLAGLNEFISKLYKNPTGESMSMDSMPDEIFNVFAMNRMAFLILVERSPDSTKFKSQLAEWISERLDADYLPSVATEWPPQLPNSIAWAIVEGIINILRSCSDDDELTKANLRLFLDIVISLPKENQEKP